MLLALSAGAAGAAPAPAPREILHEADRARGNLAGIVWQIELRSVTRSGEQSMAFEVSSRAYDLLAESTAPPKDKGKRLLMVNGNMWFDRPGLSKPVPIAQRQRLLGQAAYGDIAATNYANDYDATPLPDEVIDGESCYVFDLTANTARATYDRIRYWVSKSRRIGLQAHYFTASGKLFKSATMDYANVAPARDGAAQPLISSLTIRDELATKDVTTLTFRDPTFAKLPDRIFNLNLFSN